MTRTVPWIAMRLIEHHAYCRRQAVLTVREPWIDNRHTAHGIHDHARIDTGTSDSRRGVRVHHSVPLRHDELYLHGVADTVEERGDGTLTVVEHKSGHAVGAQRPATLQVVAQSLTLQRMTGRTVLAAIYTRKDNHRVPVDPTTHLTDLLATLDHLRQDLTTEALPPWTTRRSLCTRCSLKPGCMPEIPDHRGCQ